MKIKFFVNNIETEAELEDNKTAKEIYDSLPIDGAAHRRGDEVYFVIPIILDLEKDATDIVEKGDVAYWPEGCCISIYFGKAPDSAGPNPLTASKVNLIGKIKGDPSAFNNVRNGDLIIVEKC